MVGYSWMNFDVCLSVDRFRSLSSSSSCMWMIPFFALIRKLMISIIHFTHENLVKSMWGKKINSYHHWSHTHTQNNHIIYTFFLLVLPLFICWTKLMKFLIKKKENQINHHHRSMIKLIFIDWLWLIEKNDVFLNYNGNKKKKKLAAKSIKKSCCYCCCW